MARYNIQPHSATVSGRSFTLWGSTTKIDDFVDGLNIDESSAETYDTSAVSSHTRSFYPGGPTVTVAAHNRTRSSDNGVEGTSATPGRRVWFERRIGTPPFVNTVKYQATYTGSWRALKEYCLANVNLPFTLRRESGKSFTISNPVP